jgi:hypothetical protein
MVSDVRVYQCIEGYFSYLGEQNLEQLDTATI